MFTQPKTNFNFTQHNSTNSTASMHPSIYVYTNNFNNYTRSTTYKLLMNILRSLKPGNLIQIFQTLTRLLLKIPLNYNLALTGPKYVYSFKKYFNMQNLSTSPTSTDCKTTRKHFLLGLGTFCAGILSWNTVKNLFSRNEFSKNSNQPAQKHPLFKLAKADSRAVRHPSSPIV